MSPLSPSIEASFAGHVDLQGRAVPVTVLVADRTVSLQVGSDSIGAWTFDAIKFVENETGVFTVQADGDSLAFRPGEVDRFRSFVEGAPEESLGFALPARESDPEVHRGDLGLDRDLVESETTDLDWSDPPDELFAAGLTGADPETSPVFNPAAARSEVPETSVDLAMETETVPLEPVTEVPEPEPVRPTTVETKTIEEPVEVATTAEPALPEQSRFAAIADRLRDRSISHDDEEPVDTSLPKPKKTSIADRLGTSTQPMTDSENLRQWAVVVGGGLVGLVLLAAIVWAVMNFVGSEPEVSVDTAVVQATPTTAASVNAAPPVVSTTTSTTVAPAPTNATQFADQWNRLAADYAPGLALAEPEGPLPLSVDVTPAINLEYGANGALTLRGTPQGTESDRDILVAMGIAVLWAEPSVDPAGRRAVMDAVGIDVDNPQLAAIGGELVRGGWVYSAVVNEGTIVFAVTPAG